MAGWKSNGAKIFGKMKNIHGANIRDSEFLKESFFYEKVYFLLSLDDT